MVTWHAYDKDNAQSIKFNATEEFLPLFCLLFCSMNYDEAHKYGRAVSSIKTLDVNVDEAESCNARDAPCETR